MYGRCQKQTLIDPRADWKRRRRMLTRFQVKYKSNSSAPLIFCVFCKQYTIFQNLQQWIKNHNITKPLKST